MIKEIEFNNFRQFTKQKFNLSNKVLIIGNNSLGKTSILEGLSIISITKSHQTNNLIDVIEYDKEFSNIKVLDSLNNQYKVVISKKGKSFFYNKNEIKLLSSYLGKLPLIFFSPLNLNLIKGSPSGRRQFLNLQISQFNPTYLKNLNIYNNLLKERNLLLKNEKVDLNLLNVLTKQMADICKVIMEIRIKFIDDINKIINKIHNRLKMSEDIKVIYDSNLNLNHILEDFNSHLDIDIRNKQTEVGIQRDDIIFLLNDKEAYKYASLGQIRSIVLSLQLTLAVMYKKEKGNYPLILLDDVFGELDSERINNLLKILNNLDQVIITSVDLKGINKELIKDYQIINLGVEDNG